MVASLAEADICRVSWVNNDRLVFDVRDRSSGEGRAVARGLWAVDRDGGRLKQWVSAGGLRAVHLARLNTRTGERRTLTEDAPEQAQEWLLDAKGRPVLTTRFDEKNGYQTFRRDVTPNAGAPWQPWEQGDMVEGRKSRPLWVGPQGELLLSKSAGGVQALFLDAQLAAQPPVALEWVSYPDEGHGWRKPGTQADFWGRVERFLARHLGPH